jgi:TonB family protein
LRQRTNRSPDVRHTSRVELEESACGQWHSGQRCYSRRGNRRSSGGHGAGASCAASHDRRGKSDLFSDAFTCPCVSAFTLTRRRSHPRPAFKTASLADLASPPIEFPTGRADATPGDATGTTSGSGSSTAFQAEEVDRQAALIGGTVGLTYPEPLRRSGIGGEVVALFVVGPDGRADADSVRFLRSDNALFDEAVRQALRRMRFRPAEIAGRKVSQLVQMPFVFTIER